MALLVGRPLRLSRSVGGQARLPNKQVHQADGHARLPGRQVCRIVIIVGKSVSPSAVVRNLVKRRIRAAIRMVRVEPTVPWSIVARPEARKAAFLDIVAAVREVLS